MESCFSRRFLYQQRCQARGGVLSPLLFNVYLDELLSDLQDQGIGCHLHGVFVGAHVYADDVTLLAPTSTALNAMLTTCTLFAESHDLTFNASKTKCMYFTKSDINTHDCINFMNNAIEFVNNTQLLGIYISNDILDRNINCTVQHYYSKCNSILYDFKDITSCDLKSKLCNTYFLDLYGSPLWNYSKDDVLSFYTAWRKSIRRIWKLPPKTHCNLLPTINNCLPIDICLEKRCAKYIWSCLHSPNKIVKLIAMSARYCSFSGMGDNYRYLSYKYTIGKHIWLSPLHKLLECFDVFVSNLENGSLYGSMIRDLCIQRDNNDYYILTNEEMVMLIEYLCTI